MSHHCSAHFTFWNLSKLFLGLDQSMNNLKLLTCISLKRDSYQLSYCFRRHPWLSDTWLPFPVVDASLLQLSCCKASHRICCDRFLNKMSSFSPWPPFKEKLNLWLNLVRFKNTAAHSLHRELKRLVYNFQCTFLVTGFVPTSHIPVCKTKLVSVEASAFRAAALQTWQL